MSSRFNKSIGAATLLGAGATAAAALANLLHARRAPTLPLSIDAEAGSYDWDGGRVAFYTTGTGRPVLLLHNHGLCASTYEVRKAFTELSKDFRVFAPDLPGFGLSERRAREYFADTYIRFIHDFIRDVIGEACTVIAAGVSAAHVLNAAREDDRLFTRLVLASPAGLEPRLQTQTTVSTHLQIAARVPVWGQSAFNAMVSRRAIERYYKREVYQNPRAVSRDLIDYGYLSARQPYARFAPVSLMAGAVHADALESVADIRIPMMFVWGEDDRQHPYAAVKDTLPQQVVNIARLIPNCGAAPYDECMPEFVSLVRD